MSEFLHERTPIEGICIVCQSEECLGAESNTYAPLRCSQRIPILLQHGTRWLIKENIEMFSKFSSIIGGTIQLNSGDIGEGIAAIISGQPAAGIGGHGPGMDLVDGEVKSISEIGGVRTEKRRFNHDSGEGPTEYWTRLRRRNQWLYYLQLYGLCKLHDVPVCPICSRDYKSLNQIHIICHRVSTEDPAYNQLLNRWLSFVAIEGRGHNNFQLNAEQNPNRDIVTNTLGQLSLPLYIDAIFNIDEDRLIVRDYNANAGEDIHGANLVEVCLLLKEDLVQICTFHGISNRGNVEDLETRLNQARVPIRGIRAFYDRKLELGQINWNGRFGGSTRRIDLDAIRVYLEENTEEV